MSGRVGIITTGEVTIVRGDNGVLVALLNVLTIPLTNAGPAGVSQDGTTEFVENISDAVTFNGGTNLFRAGSYIEGNLGFETMFHGVLGNAGATTHIFVGRVGAGTDQTDLNVQRITVLLGVLTQFADGMGQIGSEGTVDMGFQSVQVNFDEFIVLAIAVGRQDLRLEFLGFISDARATSGFQVSSHTFIEGEH
ncbi:hypothetical protein FF38_06588 [Lucilia cuprina]|uniref:Uncharacterized protein n=1 Tax=Lucilia cuprina TaxID=7375 RepID=A0A0L0CB28_LUCCU|nr:hypothetical protein FF38_06588 [Lucilia cuprina]